MSSAPAKRRRLDSEDDEDEYAVPAANSPLLPHAVSMRFPTDEMPALEDGEVEGEEADAVVSGRVTTPAAHVEADDPVDLVRATVDVPPAGHPSAAVSPKPHAFVEEDEDVPAEYRCLFSAELLNVLFVPLDHICTQKSCTDKLLAQYAPAMAASKSTSGRQSYHNAYGIAPGFRWDGVVRGRGPVD
ncbi:hypothetical protein LSCM4_04365 [Leishmania orientalis]|uniref:Pre-mRNA-splicing factor of RES complex n=1 Tax=Leishmania orientalis TaxID=2249476 RepID=A0A836HI48_9TRYP|nr:hypothetical protein LSCM4_04365 [Leishmania orientalis]